MTTLCTPQDVEKRLRRPLTDNELDWLDGMIQEAQGLVLNYLGTPPGQNTEAVPKPITIVTSRMVARVIQEGDIDPQTFGTTSYAATAGPFAQNATFTAGSRTGAPWLTKLDKTMLDPFRIKGKAFSIDTAPTLPKLTREQAQHLLITSDRGWI